MGQTTDFSEPAGQPAVFILSDFFEFKERMRPDFAGGNVIPIDFKNFQNLPALVAHAGEMHHDVDAGCNLSADCRDWNGQAHQNHGFKARKHVLRTVSMTGAEAAVMAGVETLKHIDGFSASDFPHYYPVWTHNKKVRFKA